MGNLFEHGQVAQVFCRGRCQVIALEIETGPQGVFAQTGGGDIAFGTHHGAQGLALRSLRQAGDLPANALERQLGALGEALDFSRTGEHHHGGAGKQSLAVPGLPTAFNLAQFQRIVMGEQLNLWMRSLPLAQRRWVDPAAFGIEQAAVCQSDTGHGLCFGLIQQVQQVRWKRRGQLRLAFGFLGIEGQLQHAAIVPVAAPLQVFEQTSGVAESTDDHLRQRRAMGG
ncbi:hypothetical protein D3C73_480290 [compost metagenome]